MRFLKRRLILGLLPLLLLFSTVFASVSVNAQSAGTSTYTFDNSSGLCELATGSTVGITETSQESGGTLTYSWCPASESATEFTRDGTSDRIVVTAANPGQATRQTSAGQNTAIAIGNPDLFAQQNPDASDASANGDDSSCESIGVWAWAACPAISFLSGAINWMDSRIQGLLEVGEGRYTNPELRTAWVNFRNIAYIILIPIMLVMVIGTALGFDIFSAYTVKKALPRMAIAVVFITLSWHITTFLIGFFNVLGGGILGLMTSPFGIDNNMSLETLFGASSSNVGDVASTAGSAAVQWTATLGALAGLALVATTPGGLAILLLYLVPVIGFVLGAFLVLMMREIFVLAGVLLAPVAILSWIFPGNDGLWKLWWNTFSKLLMMFPLIMIVIGAGRIAAHMIDISDGGGVQSIINPLLKLTAYILPYMFIPFAFKFAGGVFANLAGMVNDREKGLFDRIRKTRSEKLGQWNERRKSGNWYQNAPENSLRGRINNRAERISNIGKAGWSLNRAERRARIDSALGTQNIAAAHQAMKENQELAVLLGNEDYAEAGRSGKGYVRDSNGQYVYVNGQRVRRDGSDRAIRAYLSSRGYSEEDIQSVRHARRGISQDVFNMAAVLSIPGTGTGFAGGAGEMDAAINETVGNNRRLAATMLAEMRGTAERAGRTDLKGGGFGKRREAMELQYRAENAADSALASGSITEREYEISLQRAKQWTTENVVDMAVFGTDSRGIVSMKANQIEEKILPNINLKLDNALRVGDRQEYEKQLARIASLYDQSQYATPQIQEIIAKLMSRELPRQPIFDAAGQQIPGPTAPITVREALESVRNHPDFLNFRRELGGRSAEEIERMTQAERIAYEAEMERRRNTDEG